MNGSIKAKASIAATAAALALGGSLAGCNREPEADNSQVSYALPELPATLPLVAGTGSPVASALDASALPDVDPIGVARVSDPRQAYGFADAAYANTEALGDAPPDYGFDYGDVEPWAWQSNDDSLVFAEPLDEGYRAYYYRPGATEPYFIRDPYYSYGFAGGLLAVVYAADGGIVPYVDYGPRLAFASRYYARGRDLYVVSQRARRRPIYASTWVVQRPIIIVSRERWGSGRARQPAWAAYHRANFARQQRHWREEAIRRRADSRRFGEWREAGFRTAPPPRAIPAVWKDARWARDNRRYHPASDKVREAVIRERRDARQDQREAAERRQAAERIERRGDRRQAQRQEHQNRSEQARRQDHGRDQQEIKQARREQARRDKDLAQTQSRQEQGRQDRAEARRGREQRQRNAAQVERKQEQRERAERRADRPGGDASERRQRRQEPSRVERARAEQQQRLQPAARLEERREARQAQREEAQASARAQAERAQAQREQVERARAEREQSRREQAQRRAAPQIERARQQPQPQMQPQPQAQRQEAREDRQAARQQRREDRRNR